MRVIAGLLSHPASVYHFRCPPTAGAWGHQSPCQQPAGRCPRTARVIQLVGRAAQLLREILLLGGDLALLELQAGERRRQLPADAAPAANMHRRCPSSAHGMPRVLYNTMIPSILRRCNLLSVWLTPGANDSNVHSAWNGRAAQLCTHVVKVRDDSWRRCGIKGMMSSVRTPTSNAEMKPEPNETNRYPCSSTAACDQQGTPQ